MAVKYSMSGRNDLNAMNKELMEEIISNKCESAAGTEQVTELFYTHIALAEEIGTKENSMTAPFELRALKHAGTTEMLKNVMDSMSAQEQDESRPLAERRDLAMQIINLTYMYEALTEHSIEKCKECFKKSGYSVNVFMNTHELAVFPAEEYGLGEGDIVASFYDGISGSPDLLKQLSDITDLEERKAFIKEHIELTSLVLLPRSSKAPLWVVITEESPYLMQALMAVNEVSQ